MGTHLDKTEAAFTDFHEVLPLIYLESLFNYHFLCLQHTVKQVVLKKKRGRGVVKCDLIQYDVITALP